MTDPPQRVEVIVTRSGVTTRYVTQDVRGLDVAILPLYYDHPSGEKRLLQQRLSLSYTTGRDKIEVTHH